MKRFHVHVSVDNLSQSIVFYSAIFGQQPSLQKSDYAKWMLDDPRINFAISHRGHQRGVNHLGLQVDQAEELQQLRAQLEAADASLVQQSNAACCYAKSDKYWVTDPSGIAWETFHTLGDVPVYGDDTRNSNESACCVPVAVTTAGSGQASCGTTGTSGGSCAR